MMRLCVILIISCSLCSILRAEQALSIDYHSQGKSLDAILDHLTHFADFKTSIDAALLQEHILNVPVHVCLQQADRQMCLDAICHALQRKVWWRIRSDGVHFTRKAFSPQALSISSQLYQSNMPFADETLPLIKQSLAAHLQAPKAGLGFIPQQRQWSASLSAEGHTLLKRNLKIFERGHSDFPIIKSNALKRVLAITEDIRCRTWSQAIQEIAKQLKCNISLSADLAEQELDIHIAPCPPEQLLEQLHRKRVNAAWVNNVLCIGGHIQTWEHPLNTHSIWLPLSAYEVNEQERISTALKRCCHQAYWQQDGIMLVHIPKRQACFIQAHASVIGQLIERFQHIDRQQNRP